MRRQLAGAILDAFEQLLYSVPKERRPLGLALFRAALAVTLDGTDQVGSALRDRALAWSSESKSRTKQVAVDAGVHHVVSRVRRLAEASGRKPPPLTRLRKKNRRTAFAVAARALKKDAATVEGAYLRHQARFGRPPRKS